MTTDKKKINVKPTYKRLAVVALALMLFIGSGIGVTHLTNDENSNDFGMLVANAAEASEFKSTEELGESAIFKLDTERTHDIDDFESYENFDYDNLMLVPDIDNYTDVDNLTVSCQNGNLHLELITPYTHEGNTFDVDTGYVSDSPGENAITVSGEQIVYSQQSQERERYLGNNDKGYYICWDPHYEVVQALMYDDKGYDLTQLKDSITITLKYKDGTVKTTTLKLYFDKDGYMYFE